MTDNELLALIEFVRNIASDVCRKIENSPRRSTCGDAYRCQHEIHTLDCHAILTQWKTRLNAAIKELR